MTEPPFFFLAFLQALYRVTPDVSFGFQQSEIENRMRRPDGSLRKRAPPANAGLHCAGQHPRVVFSQEALMTISGWMLALALAVQTAPQAAPPVDRQRAPDTVDDIAVTGVNAEAVNAFVGELLEPARLGRNAGQIARWNDPLCVRVIGGEPDVNTRLGEQIADAFRSLGAPLEEGYCRKPNVMVVIADNAGGFARVVTQRYSNRLFGMRRQDMAEFANPARPVRWQHRTRTTAIRRSAAATMVAANLQGSKDTAAADLPNSRLSLSTAEEIDRALIVIDPRRLDDVRSRGLAAYVAFAVMLDLPQLPDVVGADTILNLFAPGGPTELTAWDRALVAGVYAVGVGQPFTNQESQITRDMRRSLVDAALTPPAP